MSRLTDEKYWNEIWDKIKLPARIRLDRCYSYKIVDHLLKKYLKKDKKKKFIELGCSPAQWLVYFNEEYGYKVQGIDNNQGGVILSKKNLELNNIKGKIYNQDIFKMNLKKDYFDVVFSFGLIEHFDDPTNVIKLHLDLLKKGGIIILGIPNLKKAIYGPLQKSLNKSIYDGVKDISKKDLEDHLRKLRVKKLFCDYLGVFHWGLINVDNRNKIFQKMNKAIDLLTSKLLFFMKPNKEKSYFSPYIFYIGRKEGERKR